ncbi:MAG: hypothetical protein ACXAEU_01040 [Candidatus Hodarchaeales archaeon]|jgi:hypothetical protein
MSETYINKYVEWEELVQMILKEDKSLRKQETTPLAAAFVLLAQTFSDFKLSQEFKLWRAMIKMFDTKKVKIDISREDRTLIASVLLLAAEIGRKTKSK